LKDSGKATGFLERALEAGKSVPKGAWAFWNFRRNASKGALREIVCCQVSFWSIGKCQGLAKGFAKSLKKAPKPSQIRVSRSLAIQGALHGRPFGRLFGRLSGASWGHRKAPREFFWKNIFEGKIFPLGFEEEA
jgi:hypothetical protein